MFIKNCRGAALYQYIIIIVLIALAATAVFMLLGNQINAYLTSYNKSLDDINTGITLNQLTNLKAGNLGGTPAKPVKKCAGKVCTIDYGDFILTGVPENIDDYIQSSGSSGGFDKLAALINQIASQGNSTNVCKSNPGECMDNIKRFAKLLQIEGSAFKFMEDYLGGSNTTADLASFYNSSDTMKDHGYTIPSQFASLQSETGDIEGMNFNLWSFNTNIAEQRQYLVDNGTQPPYASPARALMVQYDKLMTNPDVSDSVKEVLKRIYGSAGTLSDQATFKIQMAFPDPGTGLNTGSCGKTGHDPFTGASSISMTGNYGDINDALHPGVSTGLDLSSALK